MFLRNVRSRKSHTESHPRRRLSSTTRPFSFTFVLTPVPCVSSPDTEEAMWSGSTGCCAANCVVFW
jgi:hypothetical protein